MSLRFRSIGSVFIVMTLSVLLFFSVSGFSQSRELPASFHALIDSASELIYSDFYESDKLLREAEGLLKNTGVRDYPLAWIELNHQRAMACIFNHRFSQTRGYLRRSFAGLREYRSRIGDDQTDSLWYATMFLESIYLNGLGKYDSALLHLVQVEKFFKARPWDKDNCRELYRILQYQANIYVKKGEYESGINGYLASNQYYDCYRDQNLCPNYVLTFRNTGEAFLQKGDYENALAHFWKGRANLETCLTRDSDPRLRTHALTLYHSMATLYTQLKNLDSAEYYLEQAIPLLIDNKTFSYRIYEGLALVALERNDFSEAFDFLQKALSFLRTYYGEKHRLTADIYKNIGQVYLKNGNHDSALLYIQKAINSLSGSEQIGSYSSQNPSLLHVFSQKDMMNALHQKCLVLVSYSKINDNDSLLAYAYETSKLAVQLIDSARNDFTLDKDKVILGEEAMSVYETALEIRAALYRRTNDDRYLDECFELIDKSKGAVLLDHLKLVHTFLGMPDQMLEKERQLKAELTVAEQELFQAESAGRNPAGERETLADLKKDYTSLFNEIKLSFPGYYKLMIENKSVSIPETRSQLLSADQAVIEYFLGEKTLYQICVTSNSTTLHTSDIGNIQKDVAQLKDLISRPNVPANNVRHLATLLYEKLVHPWIKKIDTTISSIIFIPHGSLSYLPFEILSSNDAQLLVDRFDISYASSASLLLEQEAMSSSGHALAGFNADYPEQSSFASLGGSFNELQSIENILGNSSTIFLNSTADQFRQHAPDFKVLHLALHSFINDEKPLFSKLVFSADDSGNTTEITANELYAMQLNAELAVLSACESGIGKLHKGEGMMSLSRAFMYAGVPSTVISLWKVPDHATARLMEKFYTFLKEGQRKDEALANAKRSFINAYPEMSAPYFWAGFIVNGKSDPLTFSVLESAEWSRYSIFILFGAIILTAIIQWRRHHTKEESVQTFVNHR